MKLHRHWQRIATLTLVLLALVYILLPDTFDRPSILIFSATWMLMLGLWGITAELGKLFRR